jgi:hypothetical protein
MVIPRDAMSRSDHVDDSALGIKRDFIPSVSVFGMADVIPLAINGLQIGKAYIFSRAGDKIEKHTHGNGKNHITIVARGSVRYATNDIVKDCFAPFVFVVPQDVEHSFEGLEDGTCIFNLNCSVFDPSQIFEIARSEIKNIISMLSSVTE